MNKTDDLYLKDILDSILNIEKYVGQISLEEFEEDDMRFFAVIHMFEIIGEAASKLSRQFLKQNPNFPAKQAIEMRNVLIHGYDQIKLSRVWDTIKKDLPPLKQQIEEIIQSLKS